MAEWNRVPRLSINHTLPSYFALSIITQYGCLAFVCSAVVLTWFFSFSCKSNMRTWSSVVYFIALLKLCELKTDKIVWIPFSMSPIWLSGVHECTWVWLTPCTDIIIKWNSSNEWRPNWGCSSSWLCQPKVRVSCSRPLHYPVATLQPYHFNARLSTC